MPDDLKLGNQLVVDKIITPEQLEELRAFVSTSGKKEEEAILELDFATPQALTKIKGSLYGVPYVNILDVGFSPEVINLIPQSVAERFGLIPFQVSEDGTELSIAMINPLNLEAVEFVELRTSKKIKVYIALKEDITRAIMERYSQGLNEDVEQALKDTDLQDKKMAESALDFSKQGEVIRREPIPDIVKTILQFAVKSRASDIHIEPGLETTRIRYRIDGILHEKLLLQKSLHDALVSRIKVLSDLKIDEKRVPQDGRFTFKADEQETDLRISTLPTVYGEKVVMRLLKKTGGVPTMQELGLRGLALKNLDEAILRPHGIVIICGPTGSGKTTTLYSLISKINTNKVNIVTLEDPVEYKMNGVNQVQINPAAGLTFASGLRAFLRQDPNIIMVGEIRDFETADLAIQASLTGHLVFSTVHTKSASQAIPRLVDMGAETFLLASTVTAIVSQRICRKVCENCREDYEAAPEVVADIQEVLGNLYSAGAGGKLLLARGKGCPECNNTGYYGRIGIYEVLRVSEKIARMILAKAVALDIEKTAVEEGMLTLKQDGYMKIIDKITTIEEVLRVGQD